MQIEIKQIGKSMGFPARCIELSVTDTNAKITCDVTNIDRLVDEDLIQTLRDIADDLEEQNRLVNQQ